jgi:hypothetical protein
MGPSLDLAGEIGSQAVHIFDAVRGVLFHISVYRWSEKQVLTKRGHRSYDSEKELFADNDISEVSR